ncbi:MAG: tetratricopeptide repeat protein [Singulisphaera sp.]
MLGRAGKHAEAEAMHRRALAIQGSRPARRGLHPDTALNYNNLGSVLSVSRGSMPRAEAMYRRAWRSGSRPWARPPRHRRELQQPGLSAR